MRRRYLALVFAVAAANGETRLTNDNSGYISAYTLVTGNAYTDDVLSECSIARGRQNEPAVAVDPRNTSVLLGSSNDYCGVYAGSPPEKPVAAGPVWLGYYRSEDGGATFKSSLVPGYPGDTSPYAALAKVRTASAGDPVIAWDAHGRAFFGSESSDDPAGTKKTFGDVWVATFDNPGSDTKDDGKRFVGSVVVAKGSSAPNLLGKFHDKTAIEADRTGSACDGNVYFAWSRFNGNGNNNIYFSRSTNHGQTFSTPQLLTPQTQSVQNPDISVTGNGHVYVTFRQYGTRSNQPTAVSVVKSTDCGRTFSQPSIVTTILPNDAEDQLVSGATARDCGDFASACASGYTFFRRDTGPRSTADQYDAAHEYVYIVYDGSKPSPVDTGTTYGTLGPGVGTQAAIYFVRYDGATRSVTNPKLIDDQAKGHQVFPDISADGGVLHALWWDSRNDLNYSPARPIGNSATGVTGPSLDVWSAKSTDSGATWTGHTQLNSVRSNPNYEQFSDRAVPFAGDYLWITSLGSFAYGAWTDWRNTVPGSDPRETEAVDDNADVMQCRTLLPSGGYSSDTCPHAGGLDQDIYGAPAP